MTYKRECSCDKNKKSIFGICLGMQVLSFPYGLENMEKLEGLNINRRRGMNICIMI